MTENVDNLEIRVNRGEVMARFLDDELIQQVFKGLDEQYYFRWKAADTPEQREELRAEARAFDTLSRSLKGVVDDGHSAKHQIEQRNKAI